MCKGPELKETWQDSGHEGRAEQRPLLQGALMNLRLLGKGSRLVTIVIRCLLGELSHHHSVKDELKMIREEKEVRIYNGEKTISLTSGAGKTAQPFVTE